jgi:hypothetical protein
VSTQEQNSKNYSDLETTFRKIKTFQAPGTETIKCEPFELRAKLAHAHAFFITQTLLVPIREFKLQIAGILQSYARRGAILFRIYSLTSTIEKNIRSM